MAARSCSRSDISFSHPGCVAVLCLTPCKAHIAEQLYTVSSKSRMPADTRTRILEAALKRIDRSKGADVAMAEIAEAAGVSRQALYLHFADRTELLIAVAHHVDARRGLGAKLQAIRDAPDGVAAMLAMVALQAEDNPSLWPIARTFEVVRRTARAAEKAW